MTLITRLFIPSFALLAFFAVIISAEAAPPENTHRTAVSTSTQVPPTSLIDVNSASLEDLRSLPGVGNVRAKQLVAGRPYSSVDEIKTRNLMPKSAYDKIRDRIKAERNPGTGTGEHPSNSAPKMNRH